MVEYRVLAVDRDVVNADIALCAGPHGRNAAVLVLLAGQRDDRVGLERLDEFGQRPSRLVDQGARLEQHQVHDVGSVCGQLQRIAAAQKRAAGQRFEFGQVIGSEFTAAEIQDGVTRHLETRNRQGHLGRGIVRLITGRTSVKTCHKLLSLLG